MILVMLPAHLQRLACVDSEVAVEVAYPVTIGRILDTLEAQYPTLRGTIRDQVTRKRRPMVRFFACAEDWSHREAEALLPEAVSTGEEPFMIVGAIAGG